MIRYLRIAIFSFVFLHALNLKAQSYNLGNDTTLCYGQSYVLNPFTSALIFPDSLVITYNATMGQTGLVNAAKVYIHSTYELVPFGGPITPWIGNWGLDDGIGEMHEIANNTWRITIRTQTYYGFATGTNINGLFMVFRNEDGTQTGKDNNGNDIFLDLSGATPTSQFSGVTAFVKRDNVQSVLWSNGSVSPTIAVDTTGIYSVAITDTLGNIATDTVVINFVDPQVNLGNDVNLCGNPFVTLNAGGGFDTYAWSNGGNTQITQVNAPGTYIATVTLSGCVARDTIIVGNGGSIAPISLGNDTTICGAAAIDLNTGVVLSTAGDSLIITYDATQGTTGLVGASKVYMHSGYQLIPFGPIVSWVGNWGLDDGIGRMDSLGNNLWRITINIEQYYGLTAGTSVNALAIVFRNADGTATGKDNSNNDIYLVLNPLPPTSSFTGITGVFNQNIYTNLLWSTGATTPAIAVSSTGTYSVQINSNIGCVLYDTITINVGAIPFVDAGSSQNICAGESIVLDAGAGFASYSWASGEITPSITVDQPGTYTITVTNGNGCTGIDVINIAILPEPVASFTYSTGSFVGYINFNSTSTNATSVAWDFNNDGTMDNSSLTPYYIFSGPGTYNVKLVATNNCGVDTTVIPVLVTTGLNDYTSGILGIEIYPNPVDDQLNVKMPVDFYGEVCLKFMDFEGRIIKDQKIKSGGTCLENINCEFLPAGIYLLQVFTADHISNFKITKK